MRSPPWPVTSRGGGETVRVYIGDDGYWYLGGDSLRQDVAADCVVVRFATPTTAPLRGEGIASVRQGTPPDDAPVILAASYSFGSEFSDVTARVKTLLAGDKVFQANPGCLLTDPHPGWNKALVIVCEIRGRCAIFSAGEGEDVSAALLLAKARAVSETSLPTPTPGINQ